MSYRISQLNSLFQRELGRALLLTIELPRDALTTISKVEISRDLEYAKVWISVLPLEKADKICKILQKNKFGLQSFLNSRLTIRKMPKLDFTIDFSEEKADQINRILDHEI